MSLVEKVQAEIQKIIDDELESLGRVEGRVVQSVQVVSKKIKDLVQSYSDLEKTLGNLPKLDLAGLTSDTAKVVDWDTQKNRIYSFDTKYPFQVSIARHILFDEHPAGPDFKPDPKKKYKLLVAFIPVEESA